MGIEELQPAGRIRRPGRWVIQPGLRCTLTAWGPCSGRPRWLSLVLGPVQPTQGHVTAALALPRPSTQRYRPTVSVVLNSDLFASIALSYRIRGPTSIKCRAGRVRRGRGCLVSAIRPWTGLLLGQVCFVFSSLRYFSPLFPCVTTTKIASRRGGKKKGKKKETAVFHLYGLFRRFPFFFFFFSFPFFPFFFFFFLSCSLYTIPPGPSHLGECLY
ncbi:hypothetical protein J3F83DRAFT_606549 [Trichoderma novae-zelandiae]